MDGKHVKWVVKVKFIPMKYFQWNMHITLKYGSPNAEILSEKKYVLSEENNAMLSIFILVNIS